MRPSLLYRRNPLAFPSGVAPGFDPNHFAARGLSSRSGFSGVAVDGNFVDLLNLRKGTINGTPATTIKSIGLGINFTNGGDGIDFTNASSSTPVGRTFAAIVQMDSTQASFAVIIEKDPASAHLFGFTGGDMCIFDGTNIISTSGVVAKLTMGQPYFIAASMGGGANKVYFLWVNLATGLSYTQTVTSAQTLASAADTYRIGNNNLTAQQLLGTIAAVMYSPIYLSMQQLQQWSADPWAFWYPRNVEMIGPAVAAAATTQYAAFCTPQRDGAVYTQMTGY